MDIGIQIIHFKVSVPVSTGTSKVDKLLKMASNSISEGVIFQNFLGGMPPDPLVLACFACLCASHAECKYLTSPTLTIMTGLVMPPLFKSLDPPLTRRLSTLYYNSSRTVAARQACRCMYEVV